MEGTDQVLAVHTVVALDVFSPNPGRDTERTVQLWTEGCARVESFLRLSLLSKNCVQTAWFVPFSCRFVNAVNARWHNGNNRHSGQEEMKRPRSCTNQN